MIVYLRYNTHATLFSQQPLSGGKMKKLLSLIIALAFAASFAISADIYVSLDGTGDGSSADNPTADLIWALDNVTSGCTVFLAPGKYSIADYYNQTDIWGGGMTALIFKVENTTLQGAGANKTFIVAPEGYVGVRMEKDGVCLRDLTIKAYGKQHHTYHYNWHMQGALCACNRSNMSIKNVGIYSEQITGAIRPFSIYSATGVTVENVAVEAPNCGSPFFFNKSNGCTVNKLTVSGKSEANNPGIYIGNWPWGANEDVSFENIVVANVYMPFTVESNDKISVSNAVYYNCNTNSNFAADADVSETGAASYPAGVNDPNFQNMDGFILSALNPVYDDFGWRYTDGPLSDNLADAIEPFSDEIEGNNTLATVEEGENENHKASVWYAFTPTEDGAYKIDDLGSYAISGYDAVLSIYTCEGELSFANMIPVIEGYDTNADESYILTATADTTYYICWDGYEGSTGYFTMHIKHVNPGPWFVVPGATGSGWTADDPTGDLALAMNEVIPGQTVNLAAGEYSIADFNNQYEVWGSGMTVLAFQVENVTLKGSAPDQTTIVVPAGYVGIRMEKDGACIRDLTVKAYGQYHFVNHYNWHLNGAICACNCSGTSISNVAVYSEAGTDGNAIRPFTAYTVTGLTVNRLAVEAPYCGSPVFLNNSKSTTINNMTVSGNKQKNCPAIYCGDWPWGKNEGATFNCILLANTYMPFAAESEDTITVNNSVFYNCSDESKVFDGAVYVENGCASYEYGVNDPDLQEIDGFILTSTKGTYRNIGWHTVPEPAVFGLLALVALFLRRK